MARSDEFDREIERIRASLDLPPVWEPYEGPDDADPVQDVSALEIPRAVWKGGVVVAGRAPR